MAAQPTHLTLWDRGGLVLLCLFLAASVAVRIHAYRQQADGGRVVQEASGAPVDLGDGVLLPRSAAQHRTALLGSCPEPAFFDFIAASPYGSDPSLVGAPRLEDQVFYVYHGWNLGSHAATTLNVIYFARRGYARLMMRNDPAADDWAVKIIVPAGCDASVGDALAVLRRDARLFHR